MNLKLRRSDRNTLLAKSKHEDNKNQIWFGTWQGLSLYNGNEITDAKAKAAESAETAEAYR